MENSEIFVKQVEKLKKSPVFAMSLGSKELFHSNFWAFLMEHKDYKALLYSLFPELEPSEKVEIRREYNANRKAIREEYYLNGKLTELAKGYAVILREYDEEEE